MAKKFNGKNKCTKCNNTFEWETYYLDRDEVIIGNVIRNVKKTTKLTNLNNVEYIIILNCPKCGHGDEVIEKQYNLCSNNGN